MIYNFRSAFEFRYCFITKLFQFHYQACINQHQTRNLIKTRLKNVFFYQNITRICRTKLDTIWIQISMRLNLNLASILFTFYRRKTKELVIVERIKELPQHSDSFIFWLTLTYSLLSFKFNVTISNNFEPCVGLIHNSTISGFELTKPMPVKMTLILKNIPFLKGESVL